MTKRPQACSVCGVCRKRRLKASISVGFFGIVAFNSTFLNRCVELDLSLEKCEKILRETLYFRYRICLIML